MPELSSRFEEPLIPSSASAQARSYGHERRDVLRRICIVLVALGLIVLLVPSIPGRFLVSCGVLERRRAGPLELGRSFKMRPARGRGSNSINLQKEAAAMRGTTTAAPLITTTQTQRILSAEEAKAAEEEWAEFQALLQGLDASSANKLLNTGSSLRSSDWGDFDASDVVASNKQSSAFKIMQEILPYDKNYREEGPRLMLEDVFHYFYTLRKEPHSFWKEILARYFFETVERVNADKPQKRAIDNMDPADILTNLTALKTVEADFTKRFLSLVADCGKEGGKLLELKRMGDNPNTLEYNVGEIVWTHARAVPLEEAERSQYTCENTRSFSGVPRRFPHQQEVMDLVDDQLTALRRALKEDLPPEDFPPDEIPEIKDSRPSPHHIILSTPTGSGKTFTAVMLSLQLMRKQYPECILVYSVPTKQVLKRVGQDCEAHKIPYWTASQTNDLYEVRRPYSIRTMRHAKNFSEAKGDIRQQLSDAHRKGKAYKDRGGGIPNMIVADIFATAAILEDGNILNRDSPFHMDKFVLYFDEPNMGIRVNTNVLKAVRSIMQAVPRTAILASATMPPWEELEKYWYGGLQTERRAITQLPYKLPRADLLLYDSELGELRPMSVLEVFNDFPEFTHALKGKSRLPVLMLRHLSPAHARMLNDKPSETPEERWALLHGDLKLVRQDLEPRMKALVDKPKRFEELRVNWTATSANSSTFSHRSILDTIRSKTGITLVATMDPRRTALLLAGWSIEPSEAWAADTKKMKEKRRNAEREFLLNEKLARRTQKKTEDDDPAEAKEEVTGIMKVKTGVEVWLTDNIDDDTLVMMKRGIAYSCGDGSEGPVVKRVYAQALLKVPETTLAQAEASSFPINVLVVDYSSVYGVDCPGVDRVVLMDDLGDLLTFEDLQQFIGRLRRDGSAVFFSDKAMRAAVAGLPERPPSESAKLVAKVARGEAEPNKEAAAAILAAEGHLNPPVSIALDLLRQVLDLAAAETEETDEDEEVDGELVQAHLRRWCPVLKAILPKGIKTRAGFLRSAEPLFFRGRFLGTVPWALNATYWGNLFDEHAIKRWYEDAQNRIRNDKDVRAKAVAEQAEPLIKWLNSADQAPEFSDHSSGEDPEWNTTWIDEEEAAERAAAEAAEAAAAATTVTPAEDSDDEAMLSGIKILQKEQEAGHVTQEDGALSEDVDGDEDVAAKKKKKDPADSDSSSSSSSSSDSDDEGGGNATSSSSSDSSDDEGGSNATSSSSDSDDDNSTSSSSSDSGGESGDDDDKAAKDTWTPLAEKLKESGKI